MEYLKNLSQQIKQLEESGRKRTANILNHVFLKLAEEEMYDRSRDFFDYTPTVKRPLLSKDEKWMETEFKDVKQAPNIQIYLFPYKDFWYAEITDYNDWDLNEFNGKPNVKKTPYKTHYDAKFVKNQIEDSNPGAIVDYFSTFEEWLEEFRQAEGIMPHFDMPF